MFNKNYIFNPGPFSIAMLDYRSVHILQNSKKISMAMIDICLLWSGSSIQYLYKHIFAWFLFDELIDTTYITKIMLVSRFVGISFDRILLCKYMHNSWEKKHKTWEKLMFFVF